MKYNTKHQETGFLWLRLLAFMVDTLVIRYLIAPVFMLILRLILSASNSVIEQNLRIDIGDGIVIPVLSIVVFLLIYLIYSSILESSKLKATLGKYFFRFKVTDKNGSKISWTKSFGRNALKVLFFIFMLLSLFLALYSRFFLILFVIFAGAFFMVDVIRTKQMLYDVLLNIFVVRR